MANILSVLLTYPSCVSYHELQCASHVSALSLNFFPSYIAY